MDLKEQKKILTDQVRILAQANERLKDREDVESVDQARRNAETIQILLRDL